MIAALRRLGFENRLLLGFGVLALCVAGLLALSGRAYNELLLAQAWQTHTQAVLANVTQLEAVLDEDRGLLYCALSGDRTGLMQGGDRVARLHRAREEIQHQLQDNRYQLERLARLDTALREWRNNVSEMLRATCDGAQQGERLVPQEVARLAQLSRSYRMRVSAILSEMAAAERELLAQRERRAVEARAGANRLLAVAALATLVLALAAMLMLRQHVRRLNDSEHRLRTMLAHLPDGVVAFDEMGRIAWLNDAAQAMFHLPLEQALGLPIGRFAPEIGQAMAQGADIASWLERRRTLDGRRSDGVAFPLEMMTNPLVLEAQPVIVCIARDLSEQRRIDRMKREFVSVVSHELRTPLTSLRGSLALLADGTAGELEPGARRMVEMANRTCDRLVALVNDILDLEKTESGQLSIHARPIDAARVARETLAAAEGLAGRHGVALALSVPAQERLEVVADDRRLEQVLGNLLSNAVKFSPEGATVQMALHRLEHRVRIEVTDAGPGIPPAFREHVFEKFAQADSTDRRTQGGTGLGLTISKALVERMDGRIGFESPPPGRPHGTMFWFELPTPDAPSPRRFDALVV